MPVLLQFREAPLYPVSKGVYEAVHGRLHSAVTTVGDDGRDASPGRVVADCVAVVAFVGNQNLWNRAGLIHDRFVTLDVRGFARRERHSDGKADAVGSQMDLGRVATSRTAKAECASACL